MPTVLQSRRFWTFIVAQVLSIGAVVFAHYVTDPFATQLATMTIGLVEGVAAILITAYTVEDMKQNQLFAANDLELAKFFANMNLPIPPDLPMQMGHAKDKPQ